MIPILPAFTAPINETGTPSAPGAALQNDESEVLFNDENTEPLTAD